MKVNHTINFILLSMHGNSPHIGCPVWSAAGLRHSKDCGHLLNEQAFILAVAVIGTVMLAQKMTYFTLNLIFLEWDSSFCANSQALMAWDQGTCQTVSFGANLWRQALWALRPAGETLLVMPLTKEAGLAGMRRQAFSVTAPCLWISLPLEARQAQPWNNFRIIVKTEQFRWLFNLV